MDQHSRAPADVAQLAAHRSCKAVVRGSSPLVGSLNCRYAPRGIFKWQSTDRLLTALAGSSSHARSAAAPPSRPLRPTPAHPDLCGLRPRLAHSYVARHQPADRLRKATTRCANPMAGVLLRRKVIRRGPILLVNAPQRIFQVACRLRTPSSPPDAVIDRGRRPGVPELIGNRPRRRPEVLKNRRGRLAPNLAQLSPQLAAVLAAGRGSPILVHPEVPHEKTRRLDVSLQTSWALATLVGPRPQLPRSEWRHAADCRQGFPEAGLSIKQPVEVLIPVLLGVHIGVGQVVRDPGRLATRQLLPVQGQPVDLFHLRLVGPERLESGEVDIRVG